MGPSRRHSTQLQRGRMRAAGDRGATAVEYGLIIGLIVLVALVALALLGEYVRGLFGIGSENAEGLGDEAVVVTEPDRACTDPTCAVTHGNNLIFDVRTILGKHNAKVSNITVTPVAGYEASDYGVTSVAGNNGSFMFTAPTSATQVIVTYTYSYRAGATLVSGTKSTTVIVS